MLIKLNSNQVIIAEAWLLGLLSGPTGKLLLLNHYYHLLKTQRFVICKLITNVSEGQPLSSVVQAGDPLDSLMTDADVIKSEVVGN